MKLIIVLKPVYMINKKIIGEKIYTLKRNSLDYKIKIKNISFNKKNNTSKYY